jgi:hypothetical protein
MASIWEKMVAQERKVKANELGVKVSDLEESEALNATLEASKSATGVLEGNPKVASNVQSTALSVLRKVTKQDKYEEMEEDDDEETRQLNKLINSHLKYKLSATNINPRDTESKAALNCIEEREGGPWGRLPQELVDKVLIYLGDIDMCGYLHQVSKSTFIPSEKVYQYLCTRTYPSQTGKRILQVKNWYSWQHMLVHRPRLRTNGFYTLRTQYTKAFCADRFWEEKQTQSIVVRAHGFVTVVLAVVFIFGCFAKL